MAKINLEEGQLNKDMIGTRGSDLISETLRMNEIKEEHEEAYQMLTRNKGDLNSLESITAECIGKKETEAGQVACITTNIEEQMLPGDEEKVEEVVQLTKDVLGRNREALKNDWAEGGV